MKATDSIDTNIVLRYILGDNLKHRKVVAEFLRTSKSMHYVSSQAILECIYVMEIVMEMPRGEIAELLMLFLTRYDSVLEYDRGMVALALAYYQEHSKISWADCALAAEAELSHREPLFTFDRKLANQLPQAKLLG